jgi:hypothetical protein
MDGMARGESNTQNTGLRYSVRSHHNGCKVRTNGSAPNRPFCASQQYQTEVSVSTIP